MVQPSDHHALRVASPATLISSISRAGQNRATAPYRTGRNVGYFGASIKTSAQTDINAPTPFLRLNVPFIETLDQEVRVSPRSENTNTSYERHLEFSLASIPSHQHLGPNSCDPDRSSRFKSYQVNKRLDIWNVRVRIPPLECYTSH